MPKQEVRPSVAFLVIAVTGAATTSLFAATPSGETLGNNESHGTPRTDTGRQNNLECWGEATSQCAYLEGTHPGIGEHTSAQDEPRLGAETKLKTHKHCMAKL